MSWDIGQATFTNGSKVVTKTSGSDWVNPLVGVAPSRAIIENGVWYEIEFVISSNELRLRDNYAGVTGLKNYRIPTSPNVPIETFAHEQAAFLTWMQSITLAWQAITTGSGNVTITDPITGQQITVRSQKAWDDALNGKVTGVKQGNSTDSTFGRILAIGDSGSFGLGGSAQSPVTQKGMLFSYSTTARALAEIGLNLVGGGIQSGYNTNRRAQIFVDSGGVMRARWSLSEDTFDTTTPWRTVWDSTNLSFADMYGTRGTLGTADLDTIFGQTYRGVWDQGATANATLARHYPIVSAGSLEVLYNAVNSIGTLQRYTTHASNRVFTRYKAASANAWSAWVEQWTSDNLVKQTGQFDATAGSVMLNGAFGLGGRGEDFEKSEADFLLWVRNINNGSRFFRNTLNTKYTQPYGASILFRSVDTWGVLSVGYGSQDGVKISGGNASGSSTRDHNLWTDKNLPNPATLDTAQTMSGAKTYKEKITISRDFPGIILEKTDVAVGTVGRVVVMDTNTTSVEFAKRSAAAVQTGQQIIRLPFPSGTTSATFNALVQNINAVADANGFWKTASPVVKLFADGTSELTSEAEGITTKRISEGVYKISGCLGLNADRAWGGEEGGIDIPVCRNKLPRLWVDYGGDDGSAKINPDGSIVIRTYHRPHPEAPIFARNEIEGYGNCSKIDIPKDTFLTIRVQMP